MLTRRSVTHFLRRRIKLALVFSVVCLVYGSARAQTQYRFHQPKATPAKAQVTSTVTERNDLSTGTTAVRQRETITERQGRQVARKQLETLSVDSRFVPSGESEEETTQVDAQTERVTRRLYGTDADGRRVVIEVTQEERRHLPGDRLESVRTTSKPDLDGRLHVTRREIQETTPLSPGVQRTRTTVLRPDINATLAPTEQIQQTERRETKGVVRVEETRRLPDGNGGWETFETRERVVQPGTNETRTEEKVFRRDANRQLSLAERTVTNASKNAKGQEQTTVETYSNNIGGTTRSGDGLLQLDRRLRILRTTRPDGTQETVRELEQRSIVAPAEGLAPTERVRDVTRPDGRGGSERRVTVEAFDADRRPNSTLVLKSRESKK